MQFHQEILKIGKNMKLLCHYGVDVIKVIIFTSNLSIVSIIISFKRRIFQKMKFPNFLWKF